MERKVCSRCKTSKPLIEFYKDKGRKSGFKAHCKSCEKEYLNRYAKLDKVYVESKTCSICHETKHRSEFHNYRYASDGLAHKCKSCAKGMMDTLKKKPKTIKEYKTCSACKETKRISAFYKSKTISDGHTSSCKSCSDKRNKDNYHKNLNTRIAGNMRSRIRIALKRGLKPCKTMKALGCSMDFFREYIENQFESWMTWDNWGLDTWHLDHKVPLNHFDLSDKDEFMKACHYTNYRPLSAEQNLRKNKFGYQQYLNEDSIRSGSDLQLPDYGLPVVCIETGEIYETSTEAAKCLGKKEGSGIRISIRRGGTAYGYHWHYADPIDSNQSQSV